MRNLAYKRVSTDHQETFRQLADVNVEFDLVFEDKLSGKNTDRPELQKLLASLGEGDMLWCHSIDRLARNIEDLRNIVFGLMDRGVSIKFVKEGLEFTSDMCDAMKSAISKLLLTLLGAVAEFERAINNSRVVEGVAVAIKRGVKFGGANPKHRASFQANKANHKKTRQREASRLALRPHIAAIHDMLTFSKNGMTQPEIADALNQKGLFTLRGGLWTKSTISKLLKRENIDYQKKNKNGEIIS